MVALLPTTSHPSIPTQATRPLPEGAGDGAGDIGPTAGALPGPSAAPRGQMGQERVRSRLPQPWRTQLPPKRDPDPIPARRRGDGPLQPAACPNDVSGGHGSRWQRFPGGRRIPATPRCCSPPWGSSSPPPFQAGTGLTSTTPCTVPLPAKQPPAPALPPSSQHQPPLADKYLTRSLGRD